MKKVLLPGLLAIMALSLCLALSACGGGDASGVARDVGTSELFTEEEINAAMDCVIEQFEKNFDSCTMTKLWYDEEHAKGWTEQYEEGTVIVLLSSFDVDASGEKNGFSANSTVTGWSWILVRQGDGWVLDGWGEADSNWRPAGIVAWTGGIAEQSR